MEPEHSDFIPWSQLDQLTSRRTWLGYVAVGVLVAVAVWLVSNRFGGPTVVDVASEPDREAPAVETPVVPEVPPVPEPAPETEELPVAAPQIYSEADLAAMLPLPDAEAAVRLTAAAAAEWFVREFFTIDGSGSPPRFDEVAEPLPHDAGDGAKTYVAWVQAVSVVPQAPDLVEVVVAFGLQRLDPVAGWVDERAQPVAVHLRRGAGVWTPLDLPAPASFEVPALDPPQVDRGAEIPAEVEQAASSLVERLGPDTQLVSIGSSSVGYRVAVMVGDVVRWPLVAWFSEDGAPASPGG